MPLKRTFLSFLFIFSAYPLLAFDCQSELGEKVCSSCAPALNKGGVCSEKILEKSGVDPKTCLLIREKRLSPQCQEAVNPKPKGSNRLFYASLILIGITVFAISRMIFADEDSYKVVEQIGQSDEKAKRASYAQHGIVLKYSRPFFKRYITPVVQSMKNKQKIKQRYKRRLASAGLTDVITPEDFLSFKIFLILGFPIVFMAVRLFLEETWPLSYIPVIACLGFFYPDIWMSGKIKQRKREVIMFMPFSVDMLALSVEAGLDFIAAITKVVTKARPSALNDEFKILIKEIKIGASRAESLRNMAWRIDLIQMSSFCATLIAADSVGASIGPILKALSKEIRQKRSSDIEKAGATAATKILFPMLFLIVPAVLIMVGAPIALQMMYSR